MSDGRRFYEGSAGGAKRSAPAVQRNRQPIIDVLRDWLPASGLVLEIASGSGEHAVAFAEAFPNLAWQPSDLHPDALASIAAWTREVGLPNLRAPIEIDAAADHWPVEHADAVLSINMVHISPWASALGLIANAGRLLDAGAPLILYGPWLTDGVSRRQATLRSMKACAHAIPSGGCTGSRISRRLRRSRGCNWSSAATCLRTI